MWQSQAHKDKKIQARKKDLTKGWLHIKRMNAEMQILGPNYEPQNKIQIRLMLNDLTTEKAEIFAPAGILVHQEIVLMIDKPMKVSIKAKILWCEDQGANSHIISTQPFSFRLGLELIPDSGEEKQMMQEFCDYIKKHHFSPVSLAA